MTDYAGHRPRTAARRASAAGLAFAIAALVVVVVAAAAFVALVLWPRFPGTAATVDTPALPVTVGGVLFNVPPAAIRVAMQRRPGAQERLDLAFLWPSLTPPDPNARPAPTEATPPIDRLFITIEPQATAVTPSDRVRTIYPRYLSETQYDGPDGLKVISFKEGSPYHGEDLFFDPTTQPGFVTRCSRPGAASTPGTCLTERRIQKADVTIRFPSEWLADWRTLSSSIDTLIDTMRPN